MKHSIKLIAATFCTVFMLMGFVGQASAGPIACDVNDAIANGAVANACVGDDAISPSQANETAFINGALTPSPPWATNFLYFDKTDSASAIAGWVIDVSEISPPTGYKFKFDVTAPVGLIGSSIDFALIVKQASDSTIAYLFQDTTLNISGGFNSFTTNPAGNPVNDYSHATGLYANLTDPCDPNGTTICFPSVPEPGVLSLLGIGLLGLGLSRRRLRVQHSK